MKRAFPLRENFTASRNQEILDEKHFCGAFLKLDKAETFFLPFSFYLLRFILKIQQRLGRSLEKQAKFVLSHGWRVGLIFPLG